MLKLLLEVSSVLMHTLDISMGRKLKHEDKKKWHCVISGANEKFNNSHANFFFRNWKTAVQLYCSVINYNDFWFLLLK